MTYPARLLFDLRDAQLAGAVIDAARELQLPFEIDGPAKQIVVVVDSPQQAYDFGVRTVGHRTDRKAR